jgi:hypothetical protein
MKPPRFSIVRFCAIGIVAVITSPAFSSNEELSPDISNYIYQLHSAFQHWQSIIESSPRRQIQIYFDSIMEQHQQVMMLIKANAKGIVVNQTVRDKSNRRKIKTIAQCPWFSTVVQNQKEYAFINEESKGDYCGYYLYWSGPIFCWKGYKDPVEVWDLNSNKIIRTESGKPPRFVGVFVAKLDLIKCFEPICSTGVRPFLIRVNFKEVFSCKWDKKIDYVEVREFVGWIDFRGEHSGLLGDGIISIRYPKSALTNGGSMDTKKNDILSGAGTSAKKTALPASDSKTVKTARNSPYIIIAIIILAVILASFLFFMIRNRILNR